MENNGKDQVEKSYQQGQHLHLIMSFTSICFNIFRKIHFNSVFGQFKCNLDPFNRR